MKWHNIPIFAHIFILVFWLGTDLANKEKPIALVTGQFEKLTLFSLATMLTGGDIYSLVSDAFVNTKWLVAKKENLDIHKRIWIRESGHPSSHAC